MITRSDAISKKIIKMYKNYGLDVSNMTDDEIDKIREYYVENKAKLREDLKFSEKFIEEYSEKII